MSVIHDISQVERTVLMASENAVVLSNVIPAQSSFEQWLFEKELTQFHPVAEVDDGNQKRYIVISTSRDNPLLKEHALLVESQTAPKGHITIREYEHQPHAPDKPVTFMLKIPGEGGFWTFY